MRNPFEQRDRMRELHERLDREHSLRNTFVVFVVVVAALLVMGV